MALQKSQRVVILLLMLSACAFGIKKPTIYFMDDTTGVCDNGEVCDNAAGYFCNEECRPCSPCPDYNLPYLVTDNKLTVVRSCAQNGLCPNICMESYLQPHERANNTLCDLLPQPGCDRLQCDNGILENSRTACRCICSGNWMGESCSDCELSCLNGGTKDEAICQCSCDNDWTGNNCTVCGLSSCDNGGTVDAATCQCSCDQDWTGNTCSECGLVSCLNQGTLDTGACQCLCTEDWTGKTCSEPRSWRTSTEKNEGNGTGEALPAYVPIVIGTCIVVIIALPFIWYFVKKMHCLKLRPSSPTDVERALIRGCNMVAVETTPESIRIEASNPRWRMRQEKMSLSCQSAQDSGKKWTDAKKWGTGGVLQHTFSGLRPGVAYKISLHVHSNPSNAVAIIDAETPYHLLSVKANEDGSSATVKGLSNLKCTAVKVCRCLNLFGNNEWIDVLSEADDLLLSPVLHGLEYTVKAGTIDNRASQNVFSCLAEGKLLVPEYSETQIGRECSASHRRKCSTTIGNILADFSTQRSLQLELDRACNCHLPGLIASALELSGDDYKRVCDARDGQHLDKLDQILTGQERQTTSVHGFINVMNSSPLEEAQEFIWKVVKYTCTSTLCIECLHLLHRSHTCRCINQR